MCSLSCKGWAQRRRLPVQIEYNWTIHSQPPNHYVPISYCQWSCWRKIPIQIKSDCLEFLNNNKKHTHIYCTTNDLFLPVKTAKPQIEILKIKLANTAEGNSLVSRRKKWFVSSLRLISHSPTVWRILSSWTILFSHLHLLCLRHHAWQIGSSDLLHHLHLPSCAPWRWGQPQRREPL